MTFMKWFVRLAGIYNASAVVVFVTPGALALVGVTAPRSELWTWLPGLLGLFAGIVLFYASRDLVTYATFAYWNGIIRTIFVVAAFAFDFGATAGTFMGLLAWGDIPLAIVTVAGVPLATGRSHLDVLLDRQKEPRAQSAPPTAM
jgi:hypothetical protein